MLWNLLSIMLLSTAARDATIEVTVLGLHSAAAIAAVGPKF